MKAICAAIHIYIYITMMHVGSVNLRVTKARLMGTACSPTMSRLFTISFLYACMIIKNNVLKCTFVHVKK